MQTFPTVGMNRHESLASLLQHVALHFGTGLQVVRSTGPLHSKIQARHRKERIDDNLPCLEAHRKPGYGICCLSHSLWYVNDCIIVKDQNVRADDIAANENSISGIPTTKGVTIRKAHGDFLGCSSRSEPFHYLWNWVPTLFSQDGFLTSAIPLTSA